MIRSIEEGRANYKIGVIAEKDEDLAAVLTHLMTRIHELEDEVEEMRQQFILNSVGTEDKTDL